MEPKMTVKAKLLLLGFIISEIVETALDCFGSVIELIRFCFRKSFGQIEVTNCILGSNNVFGKARYILDKWRISSYNFESKLKDVLGVKDEHD